MNGIHRSIEELEELFGDPFDVTGEFSYGRILAADSERQLVSWAEDVLQRWGFSAELVPTRLGGRWSSTEDMVRHLSPVFRRDPALGLGHGVTTLMAACNVWVGGGNRAQRRFADALLRGDRVAVAFHELAHGTTSSATNSPRNDWTMAEARGGSPGKRRSSTTSTELRRYCSSPGVTRAVRPGL